MQFYFEALVGGGAGRGLLGGGAGGRSTILDLSGLIAASPIGCRVEGIGFFAITSAFLLTTDAGVAARRYRWGADC